MIPLLVNWIRNNPKHIPKIWTIIGALPFLISTGPHPLYIALISWAQWPGYVKGVEVSAIDFFAIAIYLTQPRTGGSLPFRLSISLYLVAILLSALTAQVPFAAVFYVWQCARMFLIYIVVVRACADSRVAPALLIGMAAGLWFQVGIASWQKFITGAIQPGGTVGDKNLLGMMSQFVGIVWFAALLGGWKGRTPVLAPLASALAAILTVSRAAIGFTGIGFVLVYFLSAAQSWTKKKATIALLGVVALLVLVPATLVSLENRFSSEPLTRGYDERAAFQKAAELMLADHPLGVGANNYIVAANVGGYDERAGVAERTESRATNVHNTFLLVAAETGYFGLVSFALMLLRPLIVAFRCWWQNRNDRRSDLLLGLGVSLLMVYLHCLYEWVFLSFQTQYLFAMLVGLIAGLAQQKGYWQSLRQSKAYSNAANLADSKTRPLLNISF